MKSGIYSIENLIDGKRYIGFSSSLFERWQVHKSELRGNCHTNKYLQHAWNKYGESHFKFSIIEECGSFPETLKLMEIYFISYYNTFYLDGGGI